MSEGNGNGRIYEIQQITCTPFCLKTPDGVIHDFDGCVTPRKIERDDTQIIVTINPGQKGREGKAFFPLGTEIDYGNRSSVRNLRNGRF